MKTRKTIIITSIVCLLPILYGITVYDKLPEMMPTHFNFNGEVDGYTSKLLFVYGLPIVMMILNLVVNFAITRDPKNINQNRFMMEFPRYVVAFISFFLSMLTYYKVLYKDINISAFMPYFIGILLIIIGNYLPKCRQNYTIGIKLPWTLNNEENWNKTHRLAGFIWVFSGVSIILLNFILKTSLYYYILFILVILMVMIPTVYSYLIYRNGQ